MADRERNGSPVYARQRTLAPTPSTAMSPGHARSSSQGGLGVPSVRRSQNYAAKAASARLAQAMASHSTEDEDEDEKPYVSTSSRFMGGSFGVNGTRDVGRDLSPSPKIIRNAFTDINLVSTTGGPLRSTSVGRPALNPARPVVQPPPPVQRAKPIPGPVTSVPSRNVEPRIVESSLDSLTDRRDRDRRFTVDVVGVRQSQDSIGREEAALRDEIDLLQEENEILMQKLRQFQETLDERDLRNKELEKQVASFGEGISMEARLLSRKEAALRQREAALKAAKEQVKDVKDDEIAALRLDAEAARDEAMAASELAGEAESEVRALRAMTQRMILTQEEMEEVVMKRCWLARYWGLAARHAVLPEIASGKHEHWSSLAPLPLEVVISAGQKAKEEPAKRDIKPARDVNDITGEKNIESMLSVEKGLRELSLLKVVEAVGLTMSQLRRPTAVRLEGGKATEVPRLLDSLDLSADEVEDVQFKQAWLVYFWRRAKSNGVESDIADERLAYWISRSNQAHPSFQDIVDAEEGLMELQKLSVEEQLWEVSRKGITADSATQKIEGSPSS